MTKENKVLIYGKRKKTKRNPVVACAVLLGESENLISWERSLRHKGYSTIKIISSREMAPEEITLCESANRMIYYQYTDWSLLVADEWEIGKDKAHCERIADYSNTPFDPLGAGNIEQTGQTKILFAE